MLVGAFEQTHEQAGATVLELPADAAAHRAPAASENETRTEAQFAERERVAQALCDTVLHDLFAIGLTLQGLAMRSDGDVRDRLHRVVADFDDVITGLRRAVFPVAAAAVVADRDDRPAGGEDDGGPSVGPVALYRSEAARPA